MKSTPSPDAPLHTSVRDNHDLTKLVDDMIGSAARSQLWLLFLDSRDRPIPLAVPVEDFPISVAEADHSRLTELAKEVARGARAAQVVIVWEREGGPALTVGERASVSRVASEFEKGDIRLRGQLLSHSSGVVLL